MTLNTQQEAKTPLRRRASTPLPLSQRGHRPGLLYAEPATKPEHPRLGQSASLNPPSRTPSPTPNGWSSESSDSEGSWEALYRVVLLGDPGVGKTSLASLFAGKQERDPNEQLGEDVYERTLTVDGEDTTLVVVDTWEAEKRDESWSQELCLQVGSAYVLVYSIADRGSFESASELRIQLRGAHQADYVPIILVGNKADLARCREVSVEEGRACIVVFDCKFIETSATLQHNVAELFEGVERQLRLRRRGSAAREPQAPRRRAILGQRARRFLARLTARSARRRALKARSKSCHNLATVLKSRRASLQDLKKHEKFLTERNQDLVKAIQNMEENTARKMRGILQQQNILENIVDTLERWSRESLEELKCELQEWEKKEERKMHCLEQQVEQLNAKIKKTLEEINFLSTYMDHEYPVKVVQIATLVRQIQQLKDIQQDELYDLSEMRKMVLQSLSNDIQRKKEDFLKSLAMRILQPHEEILVQKARDNQLMLKYMDKFRDFIDQSVGEMPLLRTQVQHLQVQVQKHREIIFEDILLRRPKCTPDMDVILNIPVEEMLPF